MALCKKMCRISFGVKKKWSQYGCGRINGVIVWWDSTLLQLNFHGIIDQLNLPGLLEKRPSYVKLLPKKQQNNSLKTVCARGKGTGQGTGKNGSENDVMKNCRF